MKIIKSNLQLLAVLGITILSMLLPGNVFASVVYSWITYDQAIARFPTRKCSPTTTNASKTIYIQRCISDYRYTTHNHSIMITFIYNHDPVSHNIAVDDYFLTNGSWPEYAHGTCPLRFFAPYQKTACINNLWVAGNHYQKIPLLGFSRIWVRQQQIAPGDYKWDNYDGYTLWDYLVLY